MLHAKPQIEASVAQPRHVAIIMDGNGRWAARRRLPRAFGHRQGAEAVRRAVRAAVRQGVSVLTLYAFSSENWKRPPDEIDDLMGLLRHYLRREVDELDAQGVRVRVIGSRDRLSADILSLIDMAERRTAANGTMQLVLALNYGAQGEIVSAVRCIASSIARGEMTADQVTEETVARHLFTNDLPDPDLIIRTSGEKRLSNFLLWQSAYAELEFMDVLWPDFQESHLDSAIEDFRTRDRRFGARS
ncbi:undecaprenyl pyrophosphate synthetase [Rhodothalassium salexigens DSM 2132]|uniref:Isoprenyl transferase n=1 Tax=Rhodothalassium salexigens DSM 2132 TaxID=1188247 RepID=A0A4R2PQX9_RHOSA|nr:isoprenyl transferase [Rhodothalassium salexigens]MBB4210078.1 undecaprenyl diphosphate synthase [Rhodothalassium salexigens DSM 2132]MBK1639580.1 di-trans,poly-cis-decaprenylcistransferase [Rhodothalassium salexigens DSM 2132]TCP38243.1 undecaprenyl pyrophosphate synthetase [Rhodothalassium salexigens DSM 2132]